MWVKLTSIQYISENGKQVTRHHGDWVNIGKKTALLWQSTGAAEIPANTIYKHLTVTGSGVVVQSNLDSVRDRLRQYRGSMRIEQADPWPHFKYTLIYDPAVPLRLELVPIGFGFLDIWDIAVPLWDYNELASQVGHGKDRNKTQAVIRDLRVPMYDTRLMFVKKNERMEQLFDLWKEEKADGGNPRLAFLRALYTVKPFILALPTTWTDPKALR